MIFKQFQLNKSNLNQYNYFLLYGKNEGLQNEIIENILAVTLMVKYANMKKASF